MLVNSAPRVEGLLFSYLSLMHPGKVVKNLLRQEFLNKIYNKMWKITIDKTDKAGYNIVKIKFKGNRKPVRLRQKPKSQKGI